MSAKDTTRGLHVLHAHPVNAQTIKNTNSVPYQRKPSSPFVRAIRFSRGKKAIVTGHKSILNLYIPMEPYRRSRYGYGMRARICVTARNDMWTPILASDIARPPLSTGINAKIG